MAASAKITTRDLPGQVGSVGKLKRVCMLKEPNVFARYVCMFVCMCVCMFTGLVCMFAELVCMSEEIHALETRSDSLRKRFII